MQIEDVLKLYLQGILGPAHLVSNYDYCLARTINEYESITNKDRDLDIEEEISDDYVRIYLIPYFNKEHSFDLLVKAFVESSKEKGDVTLFINEVKKLINDDNKDFVNEYLNSGNYLISHSKIYKDYYDPHYLVIHKKYLKEIYY